MDSSGHFTGNALVTIVNDPRDPTGDAFVVVVNDQGQHALWQAERDAPPGWRRQSPVMSRRDCLDVIAGAWRDIAPATVREPAPGQRHPGSAVPDGPATRLVHELFAGQARRQPGAPAVITEEECLTYRELDQSANRLAHYLREIGAGPETLIGVHLERGAETIRSLLAIMKAGSGYLPLDPSLPPARLAQICSEARPRAIVADRPVPLGRGEGTPELLLIGELAADLAGRPTTAPDVSLHPDNICYAICTSGSTGHPKGVAVSHGSLACTIGDVSREYQMSARDRVVQLASLAFDTSVEQILTTLACGAALMLPPADTLAAADLLRYAERQRVTVIDLTPAYWHQVLALTDPDDKRLRSVRLMITGGDMADPADCQAAMRAAPGARLLNAYGLTETTITSALFDVGAASGNSEPVGGAGVPVGKPLRHARIMVLDEKLNPVPTGVMGEIYIGGRGVARGYLGRPALTAELFLPDAGGVPGSRMYRTGDLGRWREDGNLEVAGRADRQLKVRGFRVEPREIESALAGHPDIGQAAVVATTRGSGDTRLTAYCVGPGGSAASGGKAPPDPPHGGLRAPHTPAAPPTGGWSAHPSSAELRRFLSGRLPGYMIPGAFVVLDHMPLTPEGEPDRDALARLRTPAPAPRHRQGGQGTPTEAGMSQLWCTLLEREQVGPDDDFFALGGDSLRAAEMVARVCTMFGITAEHVRSLTRSLLRDPTLRGFARATQDARAGRLTGGAEAPVDFPGEAELGPDVRLDAGQRYPRPDWRRPREVLLTGSTGFLGAHLLRELLAATTARVWCLVRAGDAAHARRRITEAAARYGLPEPPGHRIVPLPGDLAAPDLGLSPEVFRDLARRTDIIYHAGALVNFIYPYQELRAANVAGTREVIRLASLYRGIPVHFVSTTAVLAGLGVVGVREVSEDTPLAHPDRLLVGYVETKFVAEELLRNASRAGLPVAIYRPLDITGSRQNGAWNTATEMCALIRFITDTGLAPDIDLPLDFVPADVCAAAIRYISSHEEATGRTHHLASPKYALLGSLVDRLRAHGYPVTEIPLRAWVGELARYAARHPSHPMTAFLPLFVDRDDESGLTVAEMYLEHRFPFYSRSNTEHALRGSGIDFPPVDNHLLDLNIGRLMATGYLRSPRGHLPADAG